MNVTLTVKRFGNVVFVILVSVALFIKISCSDCLVYEFRAEKVILTFGMIFCIARITVVSVDAINNRISWLQMLLPTFILIQLFLLFLDEIFSLLVLGMVAFVEIAFVVSAVLLASNSVNKTDNSKAMILQILRLLLPAAILKWVMFEVALISSALYGISKFLRVPEKSGWSYWKTSAFPLIFVLLLFVGPVEIVVIHYLFDIRSTFVQVLFALLFIWSLVYVYGFWESIKLSPHQLNNYEISLNRGALGKAEFSVRLVKSLRIIQPKVLGEDEPKNPNAAYLTVPGTPLVELTLKEPVRVIQIPFGSEQITDTIIVSVDEPQLFCQEIRGLCDAQI